MAIPLGSVLPGLGSALGTGLAQPISQGLDLLAQKKLAQLQQGLRQFERSQMAQEKAPGLQALFPQYSQEQILGLAALDPKILGKLIQQSQTQKREDVLSSVEDLVRSGILPEQMPQEQISPLQQLQQMQPQQQQPTMQQQIPQQPQRQIPIEQQQQLSQEEQVFRPEYTPLSQQVIQQPVQPEQIAKTPGLKAQKETNQLESLLKTRTDLDPTQKQEIRNRYEKRYEKLMAEQEKINKKAEPFIKELQKKGEAGESNLSRLDEMEKLVRAGNLENPVVASILEGLSHGLWGVGVDLFSLTSKDTQKFRKLQKDFLKNAKEVFGARVTEGEIKMLLETFPSLTQTDEGKLAVIDLLQPVAQAQKALKDSAEELEKEYNGHLPNNFKQLVEDRAKIKKDRYAKELKSKIRLREKEYKLLKKAHPVKALINKFLPGSSEFAKF